MMLLNYVFFSIIYSILSEILLHLKIFRNLSTNVVHIVVILFTYLLEAAHVAGITICWSLLFVLAIGPLPFYLAQLVNVLVWAAADVSSVLGCCISLFKILFVSHFDLIFSQDPEYMGRIVLILCLLIVGVPHCIIYTYQSVHQTKVTPVVAYYMGEPMVAEGATPMQILGVVCLFMNIAMGILAAFFIPSYVRRHQQLAVLAEENEREKVKTVNLTRVLICGTGLTLALIFGFASQASGFSKDFPIHTLLIAVLLCLMLIFFVLDANIIRFVRQKVRFQFQNLRLYKVFGWNHRRIHPSQP